MSWNELISRANASHEKGNSVFFLTLSLSLGWMPDIFAFYFLIILNVSIIINDYWIKLAIWFYCSHKDLGIVMMYNTCQTKGLFNSWYRKFSPSTFLRIISFRRMGWRFLLFCWSVCAFLNDSPLPEDFSFQLMCACVFPLRFLFFFGAVVFV